ncbi:tyrosine-type recombinase/integrase [Polynucleobacter sinensis]|uniref:tyrosine-type recombinase/integrase n=1 Tax=Polynucleobacter sinensis TaxID=1743157 RepID=UPI0007803EEE|nr:site-specific integrase [Polynucleobacter sinensis]
MTKQAKTLNERELQRLLDFVTKTKNAKRNRVILLLTHLAGMRIGEVAAVRVCDVLASDGTVRDEINLTAAQTKGNRSRSVLLNERMQAEIASYISTVRVRDPKQALFATQRSAAFTANSLTQVVNGIYKQAGMDGCSSHSGRRGFLTNLAEKGVSVRVMMALAGHANMATTQRYIDLRPGVLRNAVELV